MWVYSTAFQKVAYANFKLAVVPKELLKSCLEGGFSLREFSEERLESCSRDLFRYLAYNRRENSYTRIVSKKSSLFLLT